MKNATYVGRTEESRKDYDDRRKLITKLGQQISDPKWCFYPGLTLAKTKQSKQAPGPCALVCPSNNVHAVLQTEADPQQQTYGVSVQFNLGVQIRSFAAR